MPDLASLLTAPPSARAWEEIVAALEGPGAIDDRDLEALAAHLATWPVELRRPVPLRWLFEEPILVGRGGLRARPWRRGVELATHLDLSAPRQPVLSSSRGELLQLLQARELAGLRSIDLGWNSASAKQRRQIAARPTRPALRQLAMKGVDAQTAPMFTGPCFAALEQLDLRDGRMGPSEVALLLQAPSLARLTRLEIARNAINDVGLAALAQSRCLPGDLEQTGLTDAGMTHLASSPYLSAIEELVLGGNRLSAAGVAVLMTASGLEHVRLLDLQRCELGPEGAKAIADAAHLWLLRVLRLRGGKIGAAGLRALAGASWFAELEELDLSSCDLDDAALRPVSQLRAAGLRRLDLSSARITAHGLGHLLASPAGHQLEELCLHGCVELGPHGAAAIARSPASKRLRVLNLQNCALGADGARALAESPYLGGLRELWIWTGDLMRGSDRDPWNAKAALQAALPDTTIIG